MKKLTDKLTSLAALKFVCYILITAAAICAVDSGVHGRWAEMRNHINWAMWIGITVMLITIVERQTKEIDVKDDYIKSLEEYKVLTDEHIVTLKRLIEAHKSHSTSLEEGIKIHKEINEVNEKIIEEYKNAKPSRF